jgi:hypothetical protein
LTSGEADGPSFSEGELADLFSPLVPSLSEAGPVSEARPAAGAGPVSEGVPASSA